MFPVFPTGALEGLLYAAQVTVGSVKKIVILGPVPIVNLAGQLSTIPYLGTRFVAYLAVLAGVIGKSVKV